MVVLFDGLLQRPVGFTDLNAKLVQLFARPLDFVLQPRLFSGGQPLRLLHVGRYLKRGRAHALELTNPSIISSFAGLASPEAITYQTADWYP